MISNLTQTHLLRSKAQQLFRALFITAVTLIFIAFTVVVYGHVFSNGLCCADDATNAVVAKNLALGKGYLNTILSNGEIGSKYFDPEISTGPALNLPAAALLYGVGNVPWAPGFVAATISVSLLLATAIILANWIGASRGAGYLGVLILLLYAVTAGIHFEHWYSLLGEIPAALLLISGAATLAVGPASRTRIVASGLLFGLAVTTKLLAALSFLPVGIWFAWRIMAARRQRIPRFVDASTAVVSFCVPSACFELWKFISLGAGYLANLKEFRAFFFGKAGDTHASISLFSRASAHFISMGQHFGFSPVALLVAMTGTAILVHLYAEENSTRRLFGWLAGAAVLNAVWWLFISDGRPRYALIGLFLCFSALSCVVFMRIPWAVAGALCSVLFFEFACGVSRLERPIKFVAATQFHETDRVRNLSKTASFLERLGDERPFVTSWWAAAIDTEYALPTVGNFVRFDYVPANRKRNDLILVRNEDWVKFATIPAFTQWEQKCSQVLLNAPPFVVSRCTPNSTLALK